MDCLTFPTGRFSVFDSRRKGIAADDNWGTEDTAAASRCLAIVIVVGAVTAFCRRNN